MSAAPILPAILDTILARLTLLFLSGANGNLDTARQAAAQMLASYDPQTENEVRLAAKIISFSLHALEALGQATAEDMPMNKILRLRSGAVSLSRASDKAESRLGRLQNARRDGIQLPAAETEPADSPTPRPTRRSPRSKPPASKSTPPRTSHLFGQNPTSNSRPPAESPRT